MSMNLFSKCYLTILILFFFYRLPTEPSLFGPSIVKTDRPGETTKVSPSSTVAVPESCQPPTVIIPILPAVRAKDITSKDNTAPQRPSSLIDTDLQVMLNTV